MSCFSSVLTHHSSRAAWRCFDAARPMPGCKTIIPNILPCFLPNRNRSVTRDLCSSGRCRPPDHTACMQCLETLENIFGSDRSSRSHNVRSSVRSVQVCLELSFFNFLAQIFKQSVSSQSAVSQQSVSSQSAVSQ